MRHTSLVMRRAAKSYVEAILPSLKSVRFSSQIQSHSQGLGPPLQRQVPRSYLIVSVKAKATSKLKSMRRKFVVALKATPIPS